MYAPSATSVAATGAGPDSGVGPVAVSVKFAAVAVPPPVLLTTLLSASLGGMKVLVIEQVMVLPASAAVSVSTLPASGVALPLQPQTLAL